MDNNKWLNAQSFERAHEIIAAINTLSIHAKLTLAHVDDAPRLQRVAAARKYLLDFINRFEEVIKSTEHSKENVITGADPRFGQLAKNYLSGKSQWPNPSALYSSSFPELRNMLTSERTESLERLIQLLHDLRSLVEQHAHADIIGILGEI